MTITYIQSLRFLVVYMYVKSDQLPWKVDRSLSNPTNKNGLTAIC